MAVNPHSFANDRNENIRSVVTPKFLRYPEPTKYSQHSRYNGCLSLYGDLNRLNPPGIVVN